MGRIWLESTNQALMPFLGNGVDDQPELLPNIPGTEPKPGQSGMAKPIGNVDASDRPAEVHHADVGNVYNAPVTINNCGTAIEGDSQGEAGTG